MDLSSARIRTDPRSTRSVETKSRLRRLGRSASGLRDKRFDIRDTARQGRGHPSDAIGRNDHVVFDAHADAFVLFKRRLDCRDELFVLGCLWQIVQRILANIYAGLVSESHAGFEARTTTNIVHVHPEPVSIAM